MPSAARTLAACLSDAERSLLAANWHEGPVFRMGYDAHVRKWRKHIGETALIAYHRNPDFRAAYEAERAERCAAW